MVNRHQCKPLDPLLRLLCNISVQKARIPSEQKDRLYVNAQLN